MNDMLLGPPAVDLARDPNVPSKKEQIRMAAAGMVTNILTEHIRANPGAVNATEIGTLVAAGAEKIEKFVTG
jgi:hypothetical protein